jgi:hypothetical protein
MTEGYRKFWKKYKIFSVIGFAGILLGAALTLMKIKIGIIEGWTVWVVILLFMLAYLDGFIRKLFKLLKDKE